MHKRLPVAALALMLCAAPALAQQGSPNTTPGTVTRVNLVRIKPGHTDQFWADVRQHLKPIIDEQKRQGIVTNYSVATKSTLDNPDDWNVAQRTAHSPGQYFAEAADHASHIAKPSVSPPVSACRARPTVIQVV